MPLARAFVLGLALALAACAQHTAPGDVTPDATADLSTCSAGMEFVLAASVLVGPAMEGFVQANNERVSRDGHLRDTPEAEARLAALLQPLDIVLIARQHTLGARLIPGFLTHAALYLGSPAQLRAAGVWNDPAVAPHRAAITAGAHVIEANGAPVALITLEDAIDADAVVVIRQHGLTRGAVQDGIRTALAYHGTAFDRRFDAATPDNVYCTELAARALPGAGLPHERIAGREMILPDRIAIAMIEGTAPLDLVTFLYADPQGLHESEAAHLRATIAANWPAPARDAGTRLALAP